MHVRSAEITTSVKLISDILECPRCLFLQSTDL